MKKKKLGLWAAVLLLAICLTGCSACSDDDSRNTEEMDGVNTNDAFEGGGAGGTDGGETDSGQRPGNNGEYTDPHDSTEYIPGNDCDGADAGNGDMNPGYDSETNTGTGIGDAIDDIGDAAGDIIDDIGDGIGEVTGRRRK